VDVNPASDKRCSTVVSSQEEKAVTTTSKTQTR
jgi:ankyrin repeat domain-containing protein 17